MCRHQLVLRFFFFFYCLVVTCSQLLADVDRVWTHPVTTWSSPQRHWEGMGQIDSCHAGEGKEPEAWGGKVRSRLAFKLTASVSVLADIKSHIHWRLFSLFPYDKHFLSSIKKWIPQMSQWKVTRRLFAPAHWFKISARCRVANTQAQHFRPLLFLLWRKDYTT